MKDRTKTWICAVLALVIIIIIVKLVYAAIHYAEATTNSGGTLSANSYTNNSVYDGPTSPNNWVNGYIGDFSVTGMTGEVTKVEVCYDLYTSFTACKQQCDNFYLGYSYDGNEGNPTILETITSVSVDYTDGSANGHRCYEITSDIASWTWANITTINMHIEALKNQGPDTFTLASDYLYVKATYEPPDTTDPIVVSLDYPGNGNYVKINTFDFNFTATDNKALNNCTLWGNFTAGTWEGQKTTYDVENNTETNISTTLNDGRYKWNVECYDNNSNSDFHDTNYTVLVDTTPPAIALEAPEDNNYTEESTNNFYFNVTDIMTGISNCKLYVDGSEKDSANSPAEGQTITLSASLTNGDHDWWVNCTDSNGWTNMSEVRNISVNVLTPLIVTDKSSYEQGQQAIITGENWHNNVVVTINISLTNNSNYLFNTTSNGTGYIDTTYNVSYDHPLGQQNLTAYEYLQPSQNDTVTFSVAAKTATIEVENPTYYEGQPVYINGTGFSPNGTVTIQLSNDGSYNRDTDTNGAFNFTYNLSYSTTLGLWDVTVTDDAYQNLNDTANFTVNDRVADIYTNKYYYDPTETVTLSGSWFTEGGNVRITLTDEDSGKVGPSYPLTVEAGEDGEFTHYWDINNTCSGNFSFKAEDLTHSELTDTTYFNITDATGSQDTTPSSAYRNSPAGTVDTGFIDTSDNNYTSISINTKNTDLYLEMNWSNSFANGTSIDSVIFTIEHYETATSPSVTVQWDDGTGYQTVSCGQITNTQTEANQTCDLSSYINTLEEANDISLRFVYRYSTGGASTGYIDYSHLNISYSGTAACTEWGNSAPTIESFSIEDPINLLAGQTKTVYCNATISDSQDDMVSANATLYYYLNNSDDPDNNNEHYTNATCNYTGTTTKTVSCTFDVWYYANNGTWYCNMTVADSEFTTINYTTTTISPLYAINISPTFINYGNVPLEGISPNQTITMTNLGNMPLNMSVWGFGGSTLGAGTGLSFICDQSGNISVNYEKYSIQATDSYTQKINLSSTATLLHTTMPKQTTSGNMQKDQSYWQIKPSVDNNPRGTCTGSLVFEAEPS